MVCFRCKADKELEEFTRNSRNAAMNYRNGVCKVCKNKRLREQNKLNPRQRKNIKLKNVYGITIEDYEKLLDKQKNVCAICEKPESTKHNLGMVKQLAVDHCHKTGKVRGLLCSHCNTALGKFYDNEDYLIAATEYLQKHNT